MPERFLDVSHEALIRGWPRLRRWLDEDRAGLRLQRRITDTAEEWQRSNRDNDLLYRGARLIQAQEWRTRHESELNPLEREFLDASIVLKQHVEDEKRLHEAESERLKLLEAEKRLHEAESERVKLILEKRRRERIFSVIVFILCIIIFLFITAFVFRINGRRKSLEAERRTLAEKSQTFREKAKAVLAEGPSDPIKDITALRVLSLALNLNRQDTEAAKLAGHLLLRRVWCTPAAPEVRYQRDTLLAATFASGGSNEEIFAVAGDGQLLFWNGRNLSSVRSLFDKPKQDSQHVVQPGFASFSPDGQWLLIIPASIEQRAAPHTLIITDSAYEPSKLQIWRWSMQKRTYESVGEELEIPRLRGSRIFNFAWAPESDRVVLINARGTNEAKCAFLEVEGNTFREIVDRSKELNRLEIVALAFAKRPLPGGQANSRPGYEQRSAIAVVSVDSPAPALRKVSVIDADDLKLIPGAMFGQDSIRLSEGFQPNDIAFGPGDNELTLTSWSGIRILDFRDGRVTPVVPPTFRDQFMRIVKGPGDFTTRLVATSLYGRVDVAKATPMQEPAEPVVFSGSVGIPQFSSDGQRLLILSGGTSNVFNSMRLIDVSPLYRPREAAPENFEEKPAPPWLADIASAASALDTGGDGSLMTLEDVRRKYPESKAGDAYESVWKRFFPKENSNGR